MKLTLILTLMTFFGLQELYSQCPFDPVITGDTILCPGEGGVLTTQEYDSYQWYRREWGGDLGEPVNGATSQTLSVTENDVLGYYSVAATLNGCTESSPEILLDGYAFLLPFVQHSGEYTFDPNTESFVVCTGDTMFLTLGLPYNTSISWYRNGEPIYGENDTTLAVTEPGDYTVQGAPEVCPNYVQPLGLILRVVVEDCVSAIDPMPNGKVKVFPNPVRDRLWIVNDGKSALEKVEIIDATGRQIYFDATPDAYGESIELEGVTTGIYLLKYKIGPTTFTQKVIVQ